MEHRVEPSSWLPEGAAQEAPGAEPDEATAHAEGPNAEAPRGFGRGGDHTVPAEEPTAEAPRGFGRGGDETVAAERPADPPPGSVFQRGGDITAPPEKPAEDTPYRYGQGAQYTYNYDGAYTGSQDTSFGIPETAADFGYSPDPGRPDRDEPERPAFGGGFRAGVGAPLGGADQAGWAGSAGGPSPVGAADPMGRAAAVGGAAQAGRSPAVAGPGVYTPRTAPPKPKPATQARRANLVVARIEPWSVMKFSFLISLVSWLVLFVAVTILYYALSGLGVFDAIHRTLSSVTSSQGSGGVDLSRWTSAPRVLGYTMLIGAVNVVLITALATVGSVIYNLVTHLGGGVEITLKEAE